MFLMATNTYISLNLVNCNIYKQFKLYTHMPRYIDHYYFAYMISESLILLF